MYKKRTEQRNEDLINLQKDAINAIKSAKTEEEFQSKRKEILGRLKELQK